MSKLRLPREQVKKVLDERLRAGKDVAAKVEVAEKTGGYRDWLQLFATWRDDTITELKAAYEGQDIAREFEFATDSTERSSPRFTFKYRKSTVRSGIWKLESLIKRLSLVQPESSLAEASRARVIEAISLIALTEESITEHVEKARAKIESSDYSGAISSSYTLLEGFLKELLRRNATPFNESEGDVRELYRVAMEALNWNPKGESLESYLKTILQGLKSQVSGLYELANKAGDRHARRYNPERHHAKLAVNATFTLCEFLLDSFEYQQKGGKMGDGGH